MQLPFRFQIFGPVLVGSLLCLFIIAGLMETAFSQIVGPIKPNPMDAGTQEQKPSSDVKLPYKPSNSAPKPQEPKKSEETIVESKKEPPKPHYVIPYIPSKAPEPVGAPDPSARQL